MAGDLRTQIQRLVAAETWQPAGTGATYARSYIEFTRTLQANVEQWIMVANDGSETRRLKLGKLITAAVARTILDYIDAVALAWEQVRHTPHAAAGSNQDTCEN